MDNINIDSEINDLLKKEGFPTDDPNDKGGETQFGISQTSNPSAFKDGKVTEDEARKIYYNKYVIGPGFDKVTDVNLQSQLVDFGVNSGPAIAIQKLQSVLGVNVDGILGPETIGKITSTTNNLLVGQRVVMIGNIVKKNPSQIEFLVGWLTRAVSFIR